MGKPELADFHAKKIDVANKAEDFVIPYYAKAKEAGATELEAFEGVVESILTTKNTLSVDQMTKVIQKGLPGYEPDPEQLQAQEKLRETAVRTYIKTVDDRIKLDHSEVRFGDRSVYRVHQLVPEMDAKIVKKAYEEKNINDDYSHIVLEAHKRFFTKERMDFLTKPRTDEELVRDWEELDKICLYISESQNVLKDVRPGVITPEERLKLNFEGGEHMEWSQYYRGRMAMIVDPSYTLVDNQKIMEASPRELNKIYNAIDDATTYEYDTHTREGIEVLNIQRGINSIIGHVVNVLRNAVLNTVMRDDLLHGASQTDRAITDKYDLIRQDGEKLPSVLEANFYAFESGELFFAKDKETGEMIPIVATDKAGKQIAVGDDVPMEKINEVLSANVPKPQEPGFFSRLFNSIKEAITGTPTETVRQYREDLAKFERNEKTKETFQQIKQAREERAAAAKETEQKAQVKEEKVAEKTVVSEKANELDATVKTEMQAACETLANSKGGPEAITAVGTLLTCAALVEAKQSVSPSEFTAIRGELMKSEDFKKMQSNVNDLSDMVKESYQKGDLGSCLKVTEKMTVEMSRVNAQPQKVMAAPQLQKTMSKGGMEL